MKRIVWMLVAVAAAAFAQSADTRPAAETRQARGKRVVDEAVEALGGRAFLHMQDRVETGRSYSFDNGKLNGTIITTIYTKYLPPRPGKVAMLEKDAFGKDELSGGLLYTRWKARGITTSMAHARWKTSAWPIIRTTSCVTSFISSGSAWMSLA